MDIKYINPFIESFGVVMPQLGFSNIQKDNLSLKKQDLMNTGVVIIVGIVGSIQGNVVYVLDFESAKKIASTMMMGMPVSELDQMSQSALSELTNMLTANAATVFSSLGIHVDISTPTLLYGNNIAIKMSSNQVLSIRLLADEIPIEVNIAFQN